MSWPETPGFEKSELASRSLYEPEGRPLGPLELANPTNTSAFRSGHGDGLSGNGIGEALSILSVVLAVL